MDGAARFVSGQGGHVEGLGHHALAGESGVTVYEKGEGPTATGGVFFPVLVLQRPGHPLHDRVDGLEV